MLSDADFGQMVRQDLLDLLRFSGLHVLSDESKGQFDFIADNDLRRLAYIARFVCQRSVHCAISERGQSSPYLRRLSLN